MTSNIIYLEDDTEKKLPTKWCICGTCEGNGKHSAHLGVIDPEDHENDDDFLEDYMSGQYDKICEECKGSGKVQEVDRDLCSKEDLAIYDKQQYELRCEAREREMERRIGA